MKRFIVIILALMMSISLLVSCDEGHEHVLSEELSFDSDYHFYSCTVKNCNYKDSKEAHSLNQSFDSDGKPANVCEKCGYLNYEVSSAPEHDHVFSTTYSSSENFHYFSCTVEGCFETSEKAEHIYGNPEISYADKTMTVKRVCIICANENVVTTEVDSTVDDDLHWDETFKNFELKNFTVTVHIGGKANPWATNNCIVTEDAVYYCVEGNKEFYVKKNGDSYEGCERNMETGAFFKLDEETAKVYFVNASIEAVIRVSFEDNFDKFVYDSSIAAYRAEGTITAKQYDYEGDEPNDIYCIDPIVRVVDGKIVSIECDYYFRDESQRSYFIYYNIGSSNVELPPQLTGGSNADN